MHVFDHVHAYVCFVHEYVCAWMRRGMDSWLLVIHEGGCCGVQQCEVDSQWSFSGHTACLGQHHRITAEKKWPHTKIQLLTVNLAMLYDLTHSCNI